MLRSREIRRSGTRRLDATAPLRVEIRRATVTRAGRRLLGEITLTLQPGTVTVVVGAAGSGRTTLLDLAAGLAPTAGVVTFDGIDVSALAGDEIAGSVAVVTQAPFRFAGSIRGNLALGAAYEETELWNALRVAAVDDVVRGLPDGLDTVPGGPGATLSGGQWQQVCLARAVLRPPRLLVLDDATAALDAPVEPRVLEGVAGVGATVLVTANRPAAIAVADRVVLLEAGRIAAAGPPDELRARLGSTYAVAP